MRPRARSAGQRTGQRRPGRTSKNSRKPRGARALGPELEKLPELEAELEKLEEDRRRARRDAARRELRQAQSRVAAIESEVWDMLEGLDGDEPLPG